MDEQISLTTVLGWALGFVGFLLGLCGLLLGVIVKHHWGKTQDHDRRIILLETNMPTKLDFERLRQESYNHREEMRGSLLASMTIRHDLVMDALSEIRKDLREKK